MPHKCPSHECHKCTRSESAGKTMPAIDGMIAATGIANDFIIVTRNTSDMEISGDSLLDPWLPKH